MPGDTTQSPCFGSLITDLGRITEMVRGGACIWAQRLVLTALVKCPPDTRDLILAEVQPFDFMHVFRMLFNWISEQLCQAGEVDPSMLYKRMEEHVRLNWQSATDPAYDGSHPSAEQVLPGYLAPVWHVLNIDGPDRTIVEQAIRVLKRYRRPVRQRGQGDASQGV